jgi:malonate-semialdehyde dehydrogenase (acetylating)/methylmalonate-semialdehyde dehydrogenase
VKSASAALPAWRDTPPLRRARVMQEFPESFEEKPEGTCGNRTEEHGKTLPDAMGSVQRGIEVVEFACGIPHLLKGEYAENAGTQVDTHTVRQPVGVCAGITPFNFPVMVPMWMFPMAIACGNTFILKPSEKVPSASVRMAELFQEAGLPDGVLNVAARRQGNGRRDPRSPRDPRGVVRRLDADREVHLRDLRAPRQARAGARRREEPRGGAARRRSRVRRRRADRRGYGSAGERCMAISAVVAVGAAADPLVKLLEKKAKAIKVGAGDAEGVDMGPLVTGQHRDKVAGYVEAGLKEGAKLVVDGRASSLPKEGFFLGTSLFDQVKPQMSIYKDEIFGPVLSVLRVETLDQAIELVNRNPYANGTAIFTESGGAARRFENEVQVGNGRHQRADPGAGGLFLLRRLEELALRRPARARCRERQVLYPDQGRHHALASPGHAGTGVSYAHSRMKVKIFSIRRKEIGSVPVLWVFLFWLIGVRAHLPRRRNIPPSRSGSSCRCPRAQAPTSRRASSPSA